MIDLLDVLRSPHGASLRYRAFELDGIPKRPDLMGALIVLALAYFIVGLSGARLSENLQTFANVLTVSVIRVVWRKSFS
jgi:hypothetical protein